jgi:hypothetical protein
LVLSAEYTLVSEETKKVKAKGVWLARGQVFFPQHLGLGEPGGADDQLFENSESLDRRPAILQWLNMDDKDTPTLVLAHDKNDQFMAWWQLFPVKPLAAASNEMLTPLCLHASSANALCTKVASTKK